MSKPSRNIETESIPTLDWSDEQREQSVQKMFLFAETTAQSAIGWYWRKAGKVGWKGRALRATAIVLTTAGALIPLLLAADVDLTWLSRISQNAQDPQYSQWGYVFLALAGACVALDKFFGFSSSWIRYVTAATELQTGLTRFYIEWAQINAKRGGKPPGTSDAEQLLSRVQGLLTFVREKTEAETQAWAAEYRSNLKELETRIQAEMDKQKPGTVSVTVTNAADADDEVVVSIDDSLVRKITSGETATFRPVFPGQHEVSTVAKIGGQPAAASAPITVDPGATVNVPLTLEL